MIGVMGPNFRAITNPLTHTKRHFGSDGRAPIDNTRQSEARYAQWLCRFVYAQLQLRQNFITNNEAGAARATHG